MELVIQVLQIIWIDILLSGDNAVVIALACRSLPDNQRRWGIILGAGAAVLLRVIFAVVIAQLLGIPYLRAIGGVLLFWIAIKMILGEDEDDPESRIKSSDKLWGAVMTIVVADAVMSLDNVIAIAAVSKGHVGLLIFGLALSIPLIVAGSQLILKLMDSFPIFVWAGAALLGWIAAELILADHGMPWFREPVDKTLSVGVGIAGALLVLAGGWFFKRRKAAQA